jgi:NADH-quinone oxidoreductase subunit L
MEGPTPVSALMHAATMVAAGVFMIARSWFLFESAGWAPTLLAWIGGLTAFLAATMAIVQSDVKKVLAYSTLSQLGYMTLALGAGAYATSMFHLTTHAFFKALLFLCAGSVIHGCHHEQDMFKMGGLAKRMPATHLTFLIGMLALCGIFPLAGFWSKDEILGSVLHADRVAGHSVLFALGLLTAGMTAFYMGRMYWLTFRGAYRGHGEPHESPAVMTLPLWFLAIFSVGIGLVGIPGSNRFEHFLETWTAGRHGAFHLEVAIGSTVVAVGGLLFALAVYRRAAPGTDPLPGRLGRVWTLWSNLWYLDAFYLWLVRRVQQGFARLCWLFERRVIIQGMVNSTAQAVRVGGDRLRRVQAGRVNGYVTSFVFGVIAVAAAVVIAVTSS